MSIKKYKLIPLCVFFLFALESEAPLPANPVPGPSDGQTVRISILSKTMRLRREGGIGAGPEFIFPEGTRLEDAPGSGSVFIRRAEALPSADGWILETDAGARNGAFRLMIDTPAPNRTFEVRIGNERRRYPLPLEVRNLDSGMEFIITERLGRYARDAARAEYGAMPPGTEEALEALALLIEARHGSVGHSRAHRDYDACDLAHCVVYRGLTAGMPATEAAWRIDSRTLVCGAHFHAECGGRTMGERVFGSAGKDCHGIRDRLSETGTDLCGGIPARWRVRLAAKELTHILLGSGTPVSSPFSLSMNTETLQLTMRAGSTRRVYPAEDFRLRVNRRRGWDFLKSNDYRIETIPDPGGTVYVFDGTGNGHGAGLCQKGALELARRGYSRYEILAHYYPAVRFTVSKTEAETPPTELSYALFNPQSGEITRSSHRAFEKRVLPPGSIFKLVVALYCAAERPDLFDAHRYRCTTRAGAPLPERCWTPGGHGDVGMSGAISHSCNLFFASLCATIDAGSFRRFCESLAAYGVRIEMPAVRDQVEFARLLAGLDYRVRIPAGDLIALARLVSPRGDAFPGLRISPERRAVIARALFDTMDTGTAGGVIAADRSGPDRAWGKTATVLSGSNRLTGYGLFLGGEGENGILVVLRGGNGARAGRWAVRLLCDPAAGTIEKK